MEPKGKTGGKSLEIAMVDSIVADHLQGVAADLSEVVLDSIIDGGLGEEIPFFSTLLRLNKARLAVRERAFALKVLDFLQNIDSIEQKQRNKLAEKLAGHHGSRERAGGAVMLLLDRLDDLEKPKLVGKLFAACAAGKISVDLLFRYSGYIDRVYIGDLKALAKIGSETPFTPEEKQALIAAGLMHTVLQHPPDPPEGHKVTRTSMYFGRKAELRMDLTESALQMGDLLFNARAKIITITV